ncbi:MAG: hypothetical protein AMJ53_05345 [Gammaproteobacteria bacterium SG8_11]|nr:MAG: hypothetical protein AMJ53_05345 [Gammaproteobacteria bacterium SG8_11]
MEKKVSVSALSHEGERGHYITERSLEVTQEAGAALFARNITGEVVMLNLLHFRDVADYSANTL